MRVIIRNPLQSITNRLHAVWRNISKYQNTATPITRRLVGTTNNISLQKKNRLNIDILDK